MAIYGYARVSTEDQNLSLQVDALKAFGCDKIYKEKASTRGSQLQRQKMLEALKNGDTVVCWALDRLGRSTVDLLTFVDKVSSTNSRFVSLTQKIDTDTPEGKMFLTFIAAFAEMEREQIRARTKEGLRVAKANGKKLGRKESLSYHRVKIAFKDYKNGKSKKEIAEQMGVSARTISRAFSKWEKELRP